MLEFAGRKTLCVDVADFLELERTLKCDGVAHVTPQVDHGACVLHGAGELANGLSAIQNLLDRLGHSGKLLHVVGDLIGVLVSSNLSQIQTKDEAGSDL